MKTTRIYCIVVFILSTPFISKSQIDSLVLGLPNKVTENYFFKESFWINSINSSTFYKSGIRNYSKVELNYGYEDGDYKKVYDPTENSIIGFNTTGIKAYKKLHFLGTFDYNRQMSKNIEWSMMMDADRANPFIIGSTIGGDWIKDQYVLGLKFGTEPLWRLVNFGLNLNYSVGMGGRDSDPRPKSILKNIDIIPSITFSLGSKNSIGFSYIYGDYKQDIDILIKSGVGSAYFYKIMGLALMENALNKSSYDYRIEASKSGMSISYQTMLSDIDILAEGSYVLSTEKDIYSPEALTTNEETGEVYISPTTDARFSEKQYKFNIGFDFKTLKVPQKISLGVGYNDGRLFNHSRDQVEYTRKRTTASFKYIALLNTSNVHKAMSISIDANYTNEQAEQAFYANRKMKSLITGARIDKAFSIFKQKFCGEVNFQSKFNLNSNLTISPKSEFIEYTTEITNPITWSNYYFDSAEWISPSVALTYYPTLGKKFKIYIGACWSGIILTKDDYYSDGTRNFTQGKFGFLF